MNPPDLLLANQPVTAGSGMARVNREESNQLSHICDDNITLLVKLNLVIINEMLL